MNTSTCLKTCSMQERHLELRHPPVGHTGKISLFQASWLFFFTLFHYSCWHKNKENYIYTVQLFSNTAKIPSLVCAAPVSHRDSLFYSLLHSSFNLFLSKWKDGGRISVMIRACVYDKFIEHTSELPRAT